MKRNQKKEEMKKKDFYFRRGKRRNRLNDSMENPEYTNKKTNKQRGKQMDWNRWCQRWLARWREGLKVGQLSHWSIISLEVDAVLWRRE